MLYPCLVNLLTQASSTRLSRPGLPVYPGLIYLFTQARSKRGGRADGDMLENIDFVWISSFMGSPGLGTITMRSALKS